jgi:1-acyl-sn-glycerol-3-phosphate acyltransferase
MAAFDLLRGIARHAPAPVDGVVEFASGFVADIPRLVDGLPGDDLEGWDPEHIRRTLPLMSAFFGTYFRGEVRGLENIPVEGPSLLVGNHSGGIVIVDTFLLAVRFYERFGPERRFHQLAHDLAARLPTTGGLRRYGTLRASHENARKAFRKGAPVLVYPGGDHETFRPTWRQGEIDLAGRKGWVRLALQEDVPVVPVVAIGGQETALFFTRGRRAARLLGLDRLARI